MAKPKLSVVEKIQAKQAAAAAAVQINPADIANVLFAAKLGLQHLGDADCVNVSVSIANLSAVVKSAAAAQPQAAAAAAAAPAPTGSDQG